MGPSQATFASKLSGASGQNARTMQRRVGQKRGTCMRMFPMTRSSHLHTSATWYVLSLSVACSRARASANLKYTSRAVMASKHFAIPLRPLSLAYAGRLR